MDNDFYDPLISLHELSLSDVPNPEDHLMQHSKLHKFEMQNEMILKCTLGIIEELCQIAIYSLWVEEITYLTRHIYFFGMVVEEVEVPKAS